MQSNENKCEKKKNKKKKKKFKRYSPPFLPNISNICWSPFNLPFNEKRYGKQLACKGERKKLSKITKNKSEEERGKKIYENKLSKCR